MAQGLSGFVVKELGLGLVVAAPIRPVQYRRQPAYLWPQQRDKEAAHFGHAHLQEPAKAAGPSPRLFLKAASVGRGEAAGTANSRDRVSAKSAWAAMASVMCRCQPTQERTSYWSKPTSPLPWAKASSMAQRRPAARANASR